MDPFWIKKKCSSLKSAWDLYDSLCWWRLSPLPSLLHLVLAALWGRWSEQDFPPLFLFHLYCVYWASLGDSAAKESACNAGDLGLIPGLGRSPEGGNGYPLQYSGLENSTDYRPWGRKESDMTEWLSVEHFTVLGGLLHREAVLAVKCQTDSKSNI